LAWKRWRGGGDTVTEDLIAKCENNNKERRSDGEKEKEEKGGHAK